MKKTLDEVLLIIEETPTVLPLKGDLVLVDTYARKNRHLIIDQIKQRWDK